ALGPPRVADLNRKQAEQFGHHLGKRGMTKPQMPASRQHLRCPMSTAYDDQVVASQCGAMVTAQLQQARCLPGACWAEQQRSRPIPACRRRMEGEVAVAVEF